MTEAQIRTLLENGVWQAVSAGLYVAAGFPESYERRLLALCLLTDGLASHQSGAYVFGLIPEPTVVEVTTCKGGYKGDQSVKVHRTSALPPGDRTSIKRIPVVTPTRLLCDLGSSLEEEALEVVLEEALRRGLTSVERLQRRLDSLGGRGRRGTGTLRRLLELRGHQPAAESYLEVRAIRLLRRARLYPVRQFPVDRRRIDLAFPDVRLGIELLGSRHDGQIARARDASRHNELAAFGWTILYFTYEDVIHRPDHVVATVRAELARLRRAQQLF